MKDRSIGHRRGDRRVSAIACASERTWRRGDAEASSDGVWTSALMTAVASLAAPAWIFGTGAMFALSLAPIQGPISYLVEGALLVLGGSAVVCCARAAILIGFAPRLRDSDQRERLRYGAVVATIAVAVFIQRAMWGGADLCTDPLALMSAVLPILFLADLSRALALVGDGRHGTDIGTRASYGWVLAAMLLVVAALGFSPWWLPALLACGAAAGSAVAGARVWQRYEGIPVTT